MTNFSYAIIGTGAIGGYYGACLQKSGKEVHFLLRSDYDHVRKKGLMIQSLHGDFNLPQVQAYQQAESMPTCDVVIVALKATQNHELKNILPYVVKDDGVVLLLQNGLGAEAEIAAVVGETIVMGGLCFICANKIGPGQIHHIDYGGITIGQYAPNYKACGITVEMQQVVEDLNEAGLEVSAREDLYATRWEKLVWNIPYNGLSVVLDATTREIMADSQMRSLVESLMQEVVLGAKACQRKIGEDFVRFMIKRTEQMKPYLTSMKLDYDAHRPLEVEAIFGEPLRVATAAGVDLPQIKMLYQQLKFIDSRQKI